MKILYKDCIKYSVFQNLKKTTLKPPSIVSYKFVA